MVEKKQYYEKIAKRLQYAMSQMGYMQADLVDRCKEEGYTITQSIVSKIMTGTAGFSVTNIVYICKALSLDLNEVLSIGKEETVTIPEREERDDDLIISNANHKAFLPYLGEYYCYFFPTKSSEINVIKGKLRLIKSAKTDDCEVQISFKTGKRNEKNEEITKKYVGTAQISLKMRSIYCSVVNREIGEICYLMFSYLPISYEKLECRLGAVLTASSGANRLPTLQRILISRKELTEDMLGLLEGQLLLNSSEIVIPKNVFAALLKGDELPDSFKEYFCDTDSEKKALTVNTMPFYCLYEAMIRGSFMKQEDIYKSICVLRKYSIAPKYSKIGGKADEIVYKLISEMQESSASPLPQKKIRDEIIN